MVSTTVSAAAAGGCSVVHAVQSQWPGGFTAAAAITNLGAATSGWTLGFDFPDTGQKRTQGWSAEWTQAGTRVTAAGLSWDGSLGTNASTAIG